MNHPGFDLDGDYLVESFSNGVLYGDHLKYPTAHTPNIVKSHPVYPELKFKPRATLVSYPKQGEYAPSTRPEQMLQKSMKFIPLGNMEPKLTDDPYLFKVPGIHISYAKRQQKGRNAPNSAAKELASQKCIVRPAPPPTPVKASRLGLRCPKDTTDVRTRAHGNFIMSYVEYKNRVDDNHCYPVETDDPEKEMSISCATCCKLPKRPRPVEGPPDPGLMKWKPSPDYFGPVAFFPDFDIFCKNGQHPGEPGWMDVDGIFHPADMGDLLPPTAIIGTRDKDGKFHPLMSVKDGVESGAIGLQMANTDRIGPYLGDARSAFLTMLQEEERKEKEAAGHRDGQTAAPSARTRSQKSREAAWWDELPEGAIGGYIDENGDFHPIARGEKIPRGAIRAYQTNDGMVHRSETPDDDPVAEYIDNDTLDMKTEGSLPQGGAQSIPASRKRGYRDANGVIKYLEDGEEAPEGNQGGWVDADGTFHPFSEDGGAHLKDKEKSGLATNDEACVVGYIDKDTLQYHAFNPEVALPEGAFLVLIYGPSATAIGGNRDILDVNGVIHYLKAGEVASEGAKLGWVGQDGVFHGFQKESESELRGGPLTPKENAAHDEARSLIQAELGKVEASLDVGNILSHKFRIRSKGDTGSVDAGVAGYLDKKTLQYHSFKPDESLPEDALLVLIYKQPTMGTANIPEGGKRAYIDADGVIHYLEDGEEAPEGTERGWVDAAGVFHSFDEDGEDSKKSDSDGAPSTGEKGARKVSTKTTASQVEFQGETGPPPDAGLVGFLDKETLQYNVLKPYESVPEGALLVYRPGEKGTEIPTGGKRAYIDANGVIHYLEDGEEAPEGTKRGWVDAAGVFHSFDDEGEDSDLRGGAPLTADERAALDAFTRSLGIQVELERADGSLDLGDVFRKTFRIYSHGASIDVDVKPEAPHPSAYQDSELGNK